MKVVHIENRKFIVSYGTEAHSFVNGGDFDNRQMMVCNVFELIKVPNRDYPHPLRRAEGLAILNPQDKNDDRKSTHLALTRALDCLDSDLYAGVKLTDGARREFHQNLDSALNQETDEQ